MTKTVALFTALLILTASTITIVKLKFLQPANNFLGYQRNHLMSTDSDGRWRIDSTLRVDSILFPSDLDPVLDSFAVIRMVIGDTASSIRSEIPVGSNPITEFWYFDDFCNNNNSGANVIGGSFSQGTTYVASGSTLSQGNVNDAGAVSNPCLYAITAGVATTVNTGVSFVAAHRPFQFNNDSTQQYVLEGRFRIGTLPNVVGESYDMVIGMTNATTGPNGSTNATMYFGVFAATNEFELKFNTCGSPAAISTGVAATANTWYTLAIKYTSVDSYELFINGTSVASGTRAFDCVGIFRPLMATFRQGSAGSSAFTTWDYLSFKRTVGRPMYAY
jgi:hypothetical protein